MSQSGDGGNTHLTNGGRTSSPPPRVLMLASRQVVGQRIRSHDQKCALANGRAECLSLRDGSKPSTEHTDMSRKRRHLPPNPPRNSEGQPATPRGQTAPTASALGPGPASAESGTEWTPSEPKLALSVPASAPAVLRQAPSGSQTRQPATPSEPATASTVTQTANVEKVSFVTGTKLEPSSALRPSGPLSGMQPELVPASPATAPQSPRLATAPGASPAMAATPLHEAKPMTASESVRSRAAAPPHSNCLQPGDAKT
jgi:hypothetical protein